LIDAVASVAEQILARCPSVRVLATSRQALAVPGEVQVPVHPLPVPEPRTPLADVPDVPAARLFLDRAEGVAPGLVTTLDDLVAVSAICRRLDGIPLALVLAAARLTTLTPAELADRVADRFAVLTRGNRT
ncbi:transcriptional regulator, partial [Bradyrhizobium sp. NBAIM08]|nr:transcriptional regulator [Bradyrhizobium sp. NBAIM08]